MQLGLIVLASLSLTYIWSPFNMLQTFYSWATHANFYSPYWICNRKMISSGFEPYYTSLIPFHCVCRKKISFTNCVALPSCVIIDQFLALDQLAGVCFDLWISWISGSLDLMDLWISWISGSHGSLDLMDQTHFFAWFLIFAFDHFTNVGEQFVI